MNGIPSQRFHEKGPDSELRSGGDFITNGSRTGGTNRVSRTEKHDSERDARKSQGKRGGDSL